MIDDDLITRSGIIALLDGEPDFEVVASGSLAQAERWGRPGWSDVDWAIVDIHDHGRQMVESGTDVYRGIDVIRGMRSRAPSARTIAITPAADNPLLAARLFDSGAHYAFERWEFARSTDLIGALRRPDPGRAPVRHPDHVLRSMGLLRGARPNHAVDVFRASPLYGRLDRDLTQAATGPRRAAMALRDDVAATGFVGTGSRPRWNEIRDYLLRLTGRLPVTPVAPPARPGRPDSTGSAA